MRWDLTTSIFIRSSLASPTIWRINIQHLDDMLTSSAPADFVIHQGLAMGRPSLIEVSVPAVGGIRVTGTAAPMDDAAGISAHAPAPVRHLS
jgi:hypothetical protein